MQVPASLETLGWQQLRNNERRVHLQRVFLNLLRLNEFLVIRQVLVANDLSATHVSQGNEKSGLPFLEKNLLLP